MKLFRRIRKNISWLFVIVGLAVIIVCLFYSFSWKFYQNRKINSYDSISNKEEESLENTHNLGKENQYSDIEIKKFDTKTNNSAMFSEKNELTIDNLNVESKREEYEDGMMTILIPKINVVAAVMDGTTKSILKLGPGLYEKSPMVTQNKGNVCIAGHRTTYGKWFRDVDKLEKDDEIIIEFSGYMFTYYTQKVFIVEKNDWSVIEPTGYEALTLTACHPPGSARQRIVVRAKLGEIKKKCTYEE